MSYHYLQVEGAGCGQAESLDGTPFAPARSTRAPGISFSPGSETVALTASLSGTTFARSPAMNGPDGSISSPEDFPAKTFQLQEKGQDSTAHALPFGLRWHESLARFDPATCLWKTAQPSLLEDWNGFSDRLPRWGLMHDGVLYPLPTPALGTGEREFGYLPTLTAGDINGPGTQEYRDRNGIKLRDFLLPARPKRTVLPTISATDTKGRSGAGHIGRHGNKRLGAALLSTPTASIAVGGPQRAGSKQGGNDLRQEVGGSLNPEWIEWFMGWPTGSTSLLPLESAGLSTWDEEPAIPRTVTVKVDNWSKRIKALGNGQVPQAFLLAWKVLQETKTP